MKRASEYPTPTGPVHVNNSELCRALLSNDVLLSACEAVLNFLRCKHVRCELGHLGEYRAQVERLEKAISTASATSDERTISHDSNHDRQRPLAR